MRLNAGHAVTLIALGCCMHASAGAQGGAQPLRHAVRDQVVDVGWPDLAGIEVARGFRYIGGQRFILRGTADVEQHAFETSDSSGMVARLLWIQIEHFLSSAPGTYEYDADSMVSVQGRSLRRNTRRYTSPPDSTSDRGALYAMLRRRGKVMPGTADRVRWVHLAPDRRSEVMIIHAEALLPQGTLAAPEAAKMVARAQAAFSLLPPKSP